MSDEDARERRDPISRADPAARQIRLILDYAGGEFAGWQLQPRQRTVQGALEQALSVICRHPVVVRGAGRTDAGVHAWAQVASFYTTSEQPLHGIARGINALAGGGLRVHDIAEVPLDFHARTQTRGKIYAYRILNRALPSALEAGRVWHIARPLAVDRMRSELSDLLGTADWSAYRAADCSAPSAVKELRAIDVSREQRGVLALRFEGSGFLKQMVRILVGTVVDVGLGKVERGHMLRVREVGERSLAGRTAPPQGLFLEQVLY